MRKTFQTTWATKKMSKMLEAGGGLFVGGGLLLKIK